MAKHPFSTFYDSLPPRHHCPRCGYPHAKKVLSPGHNVEMLLTCRFCDFLRETSWTEQGDTYWERRPLYALKFRNSDQTLQGEQTERFYAAEDLGKRCKEILEHGEEYSLAYITMGGSDGAWHHVLLIGQFFEEDVVCSWEDGGGLD